MADLVGRRLGLARMAGNDSDLGARLANTRAMPLPMPLLAPVIITERPLSEADMLVLLPAVPLAGRIHGAPAPQQQNQPYPPTRTMIAPMVDTVPSTGTPGV